MNTVKLTYFKPSGKYYSSGEYQTELNFIWDVADEIRGMKEHPGLSGRWSEGIMIVEFDELPYFLDLRPPAPMNELVSEVVSTFANHLDQQSKNSPRTDSYNVVQCIRFALESTARDLVDLQRLKDLFK